MWAWVSAALVAATFLSAGPRELTVNEKHHFYLKSETPVILADELMEEQAFSIPLREALEASPILSPASMTDRLPDGIFVGTAVHPGALAKRKFKRYLEGAGGLGEEGYRIVVEKDGVVVLGGGVRGVWYGLQTLASLSREYSANLPHLDLRDGPELSMRGVYLQSMPTDTDLEALAALKCTHLFLESDAFYNLTGVQAESWRHVFASAREHYLEPVPVFSTLRGMEKVLRDHPLMIEGRAVTERVALTGEAWVPFRYPNTIAENPETVGVSISGVSCIYGRDYRLEAQPLVAPFVPERPHWRIRREPGGAIPDGAQVELRYSIATEDSSSLCFAAPESRAWLRSALERLITELKPRYLHLDHGSLGRMNQDARSLGRAVDDEEAYTQSLALLSSIVRELDDQVKLMMWSDLLNPSQAATIYGLKDAQPPAGIARLGRVRAVGPRDAATRFDQLLPVTTAPLVVAVEGTASAAATLKQLLIARGMRGGGMIALSGTPEAAAPVLDAAWSGPDRNSIWARLLNRHFDTNLSSTDYQAARAGLVRYLNEQTLRGNSPLDVRQHFEALCASNPDMVTVDPEGYELARNLITSLVDYLLLEEHFAQLGAAEDLGALRELVNQVRNGDPFADTARFDQMSALIETQQQFISPTVLFQEDLLTYRPDRPEHPQFEIPVTPVIEASSSGSVATLELLSGHAAIRRIDIEGTKLASVAVSGAYDGINFEEIQRWDGQGIAGVRGGQWLSAPAEHRALRLTAGSSPSSMVQGVRLFGEKVPAEMECGYATTVPAMRATFEGRPWSPRPQAGAFLCRDQQRFAEAPTAVRVTRTRSDLYIAVEAGEFSPDVMIADLSQRDAPLWQQESVEVWIQPEGQLPLRLIANPLGTQYDSQVNDAGWDGAWEVATLKTPLGWNVLFRIPMDLIGEMKRGSSLRLNIVRNRHGGGDERSAWAHEYGAQPDLQWGLLRFP